MAYPFDPDALPFYRNSAGIQTEFGIQVPLGGRVIYLTSDVSQLPISMKAHARTTLAGAIPLVKAGRGDIICALPGYTETVTSTTLSGLVAGTRIIGLGNPFQDDAPTLNFTATTSQLAVSAKNVTIRGLRLMMDGANGIVKGINVTAAGFSLIGNYMSVAAGAALKSTIVCELGEGATDALIAGNYVTGTETHNVTDGFKLVGSSAPNHRCRFLNNVMIASATAANGLIHVTTACLRVQVSNNVIYNTHTSSTACVAVDDVASDGIASENYFGTLNNGTAASQGITFGASALWKCFQNFSSDEPKKSGALAPAVVAT